MASALKSDFLFSESLFACFEDDPENHVTEQRRKRARLSRSAIAIVRPHQRRQKKLARCPATVPPIVISSGMMKCSKSMKVPTMSSETKTQ